MWWFIFFNYFFKKSGNEVQDLLFWSISSQWSFLGPLKMLTQRQNPSFVLKKAIHSKEYTEVKYAQTYE